MNAFVKLAAAAATLAALAACGEQRGADGLTQSERDRLNAAAASLDSGPDVVDASPDSLVATNEAAAAESGEALAADNAAAENAQ